MLVFAHRLQNSDQKTRAYLDDRLRLAQVVHGGFGDLSKFAYRPEFVLLIEEEVSDETSTLAQIRAGMTYAMQVQQMDIVCVLTRPE